MKELGSSAPVRDIVKRLRRKLGEDASNLTYIINEPLTGHRMANDAKPGSEAV